MGNSASQLPYSIDNAVGAPKDHAGWALHKGTSTDGNETPVSVFVGKKPSLAKHVLNPRFPTQTALTPALYHYHQCRKLRHPHILKVLATLDTDNPSTAASEGGGASHVEATTKNSTKSSSSSGNTGDLIIVTEPCIPLEEWLRQQRNENSSSSAEELAWGLECVVQGLHFLHASANLSHGNLHPGSLYVTPAGDVKLWNFSLTMPLVDMQQQPYFKEWEQIVTPESYRSPERIQHNYTAISGGGLHAMDSYAMGILIDYWFQGQVPAILTKAVQRLQTTSIKMRPRLQPLLKCPIFDTPLQKLQNQLQEITIQPVDQKVQLWQNLALSMQANLIPQQLATFKVLPLIQSSIQTTCTNESLMAQDLYRKEVLAMVNPMFFIMENYLDPSNVSKTLTPLVAMLFMVKDRGVRGGLLSKVDFMSKHLDKNALNARVFEPLCSGFNDSSPALREMTLKATLVLVPYLNAPNMEKLSRYLVRLQSDSETAIRANAVIFIAKIAPSLSEIPREKMLLPAYTRAMRDTFAPCRLSALQSLTKSQDLFPKADLASKVLPAITPLLLDPMTDVRKEAFTVVHAFLKTLEQESDRMAHLAQRQAAQQPAPPPASAPLQSNQTMGPTPTKTVPTGTPNKVPPAPSSGSYLSGISSWMSSSAQPDAPTPTKATPAARPLPSKPVLVPAPTPVVHAPIPAMTNQFATTSLTAEATNDDDGWGDEDDDVDGWGDDDGMDEDPFAKIGTKTVQATAPPAKRIAPSPLSAPGGFGADDEDDPFAAIGMKTSTPAALRPKGKLILPKKTGGALKLTKPAAAPATKLKLDASEMGDGWDDF